MAEPHLATGPQGQLLGGLQRLELCIPYGQALWGKEQTDETKNQHKHHICLCCFQLQALEETEITVSKQLRQYLALGITSLRLDLNSKKCWFSSEEL